MTRVQATDSDRGLLVSSPRTALAYLDDPAGACDRCSAVGWSEGMVLAEPVVHMGLPRWRALRLCADCGERVREAVASTNARAATEATS